LENLTLPKLNNANESDKILQTQLARTYAQEGKPVLRAYKTNHDFCEEN